MKKKIFHIIISFFFSFYVSSQVMFSNQENSFGLGGLNLGVTYLGNGVSFADFNNDGWDDLSFASGNGFNVRFFENINGNFTENDLGLSEMNHQTKSISWVDIDNDGDKDLFVTSDVNGNRLFMNLGNLVFQDITLTSNLEITNMFSYGASWGDYNNDGFLDVFISNRSETVPNKLYKNNGDNTFTDVSENAGISLTGHMSFCSVFFDYDNDGWQDIYIANDKYDYENILYKNNGDNTFSDVSELSQSNVLIDAMSTTIGDYNNDGWFDIYITNTPGGNVFLMNNGDGTFSNIAQSSGTLFNSYGWGAVFLDADNDMDLDLYVSGEFDGSFGGFLPSAFYKNNGAGLFSIPNSIGFQNDTRASFSNAIGDVNNDGYPDIAVSNSNNQNPFLWENQSQTTNNWLKIKLQGVISNRDGIGSKIEISTNGNSQYRYTLCGEGYMSQNSNTEFFGIGTNNIIDYVRVTWLSGTVDYLENVTANEVLNIVEGSYSLSVQSLLDDVLKIYPNPTTDFITIELNENQIKSMITIYDYLGHELSSVNLNSKITKVDLSNYTPGMYLIRVKLIDKDLIYKVLKQ